MERRGSGAARERNITILALPACTNHLHLHFRGDDVHCNLREMKLHNLSQPSVLNSLLWRRRRVCAAAAAVTAVW